MENNRKLVINSKNLISIDLSKFADHLKKDYGISTSTNKCGLDKLLNYKFFSHMSGLYNHGKFFNWHLIDGIDTYSFDLPDDIHFGGGRLIKGHFKDSTRYELLQLSFGRFIPQNPLPFKFQGLNVRIEHIGNDNHIIKRHDYTDPLSIISLKKSLHEIPLDHLVSDVGSEYMS